MSAKRPNIVLITSHDIGRHLGCYGVNSVHSPNIDALAAEGLRFEHAFCTAPQCSPSRASLYTGRYPHANGVMGLCHDYFAWDLHDGERHLANYLAGAGWRTAVAGVSHETRDVNRIGFDRILAGPMENAHRLNEYVLPYLRAEARRGSKYTEPFYLQIGYFEPHRTEDGFGCSGDGEDCVFVPPFIVDNPSAREDFAQFQGAIRRLDEAVGAVTAALEATGLGDTTIVLFTADHGIPFPRAKCSLYDPGLEIALIVRWRAAGWKPGSISGMVSNVDVLPTLLGLLELPAPAEVQGKRVDPHAPGRTEIFGEMTYHSYADPQRCIRTERHKLIANFSAGASFMDPTQQWYRKTIPVCPANPVFAHHPPLELYDLETDPMETNNLAWDEESADIRRELGARLRTWMEDTGDPVLHGIPTPPMHEYVLEALTGEPVRRGHRIDPTAGIS